MPRHPGAGTGPTGPALPRRPDLTVTSLANGLRVIVKTDRRSPVVICHVWVRVGSNREPDDLRGWAHGIEHMLFKGTGRRAEGDFAREVALAGGTTNAGTGYETTSYHVLLPREGLPVACDILADALLAAAFAPDSLDAERQVLVHENHMYDDQPFGFGVTWRWGMEEAFRVSPYRHPIGGRDEELLAAPRDEIVRFWRRAYRPDNMTAVVVGDVEAAEALATLETTFGRAPAAAGPPDLPAPAPEPPQQAPRLRLERGDLQKAYAKLIFHSPGESDPRRPALSVLRRLLMDGRSSRLFRVLREERQLVSNLGLPSETGRREGVVIVDLECAPERLREAVLAAAEVLEGLKAVPAGAEELARARLRLERGFVLDAETVQGQSSTIGYYDAMGDLAAAFDLPRRVAAVGAADVQTLAREIFGRQNLTAVLYLPQDTDPAAVGLPADAESVDALLAPVLSRSGEADGGGGGGEGAAAPGAPRPDPTLAREAGDGGPLLAGAPAAPAGAAGSAFERAPLPGGPPLYWRVDRSLPVLTLQIFARGGTCLEEPELAGLAHLTQVVQAKGTEREDAETLYRRLEGLGCSLLSRAERDRSGFALTTLARTVDPVLERLAALCCRPRLAAAELELERRQALEQLEAMEDDPFHKAGRALRWALYGDHPYGRPVLGREQTLPGIGRDDLRRHHARLWTADNLVVVASGDLDPERLHGRLGELLADLPPGPAPALPPLAGPLRPVGVDRRRLSRRMHQSVVFVAWPGPPDPDTDRAELMLLKELLNDQDGRLFEALRNRRSLCYSTAALSSSGFGPGFFAGFVLTDPERTEEAVAALVAELDRMRGEEADAAEFERARAKLVGSLLISSQSNAARVARCARDVLYGRGPDDLPRLLERIRACTPADVRRVAGTLIDPENRLEVVLGPPGDDADPAPASA